jgi:hypothetical protein
VSFTFGLFVGFFLGVLCMILLVQAKTSEEPTTPSLANPNEPEEPSHHLGSPSEVLPRPIVKD